jgi:cohesin complex subunit SA-1/2
MSDNGSASPEADAAARTRRSGRVVKAPQKFADDAALSTAGPKRKRDQNDDDDPDSDAQDSDDAMSDDAAESDDPDATPKARKPAASSRAKKSSIKKPKTNGAQSSRGGQFGGLPSRPKKSVRIEAGEKGTGLFGKTPATLQPARLVALTYPHSQLRYSAPAIHPTRLLEIGSKNTGQTTRLLSLILSTVSSNA